MTAPVIHLATSRERPAVPPEVMALCATDLRVRALVSAGITNGVQRFWVEGDMVWGHRPGDVVRVGCKYAQPRLPRRSLARWIYDTFLNLGDGR